MRFFLTAVLVCYSATTVLAAGVVSVPFVPAGLSPGDTYQIAFVTLGETNSANPNLAFYDAFVQNQAEQATAITQSWNIDWSPIVSTISQPYAFDNATISADVYLLDDTKVSSAFAFWSNWHDSPMDIDQYGNSLIVPVWTGMGYGGGYLDPLGGVDPTVGSSSQQDSRWAALTNAVVSRSFSVYAVSEVLTVVPEPATFGTCMLLSGVGAMISFGRRRRDRPSVASRE